MQTIGWIGSVLLAFCGLPQAIHSIQNKSSQGISWGLLIMWGLGEIFTIIYVFPMMEYPLLFNYSANILFLSIIIYYKMFPAQSNK